MGHGERRDTKLHEKAVGVANKTSFLITVNYFRQNTGVFVSRNIEVTNIQITPRELTNTSASHKTRTHLHVTNALATATALPHSLPVPLWMEETS